MSDSFNRKATAQLKLATSQDSVPPPPVDPPSGGGDNGDMEARLAKLEAIVPTLSTKEDLMKLRGETKAGFESLRGAMQTEAQAVRVEIEKSSNGVIRWVAGTAFAGIAMALTIMTFVLNNAIPKAPPATAQQPITINVPAQAPPARP